MLLLLHPPLIDLNQLFSQRNAAQILHSTISVSRWLALSWLLLLFHTLICALNPICFSSSPWTGCSSISTLAVDQLHTDEDAQTDGLGTQRTLWSVLKFSPTWIISAHSPIISGNLCFHGTRCAGLLQQIALHLWLSASPLHRSPRGYSTSELTHPSVETVGQ